VVDVGDALFLAVLRERIVCVWVGGVPDGADVIFFGAHTKDSLRRLAILRARLDDAGALWIVRPKGVETITEDDVREAAKALGLVDTKVVAFSRTHTAHKWVVPVEMRGKPVRTAPVFISLPPPAPRVQAKKKAATTGKAASARRPAASKKVAPKKAAKRPSRAKKAKKHR
jgi:hypothetical protein